MIWSWSSDVDPAQVLRGCRCGSLLDLLLGQRLATGSNLASNSSISCAAMLRVLGQRVVPVLLGEAGRTRASGTSGRPAGSGPGASRARRT